MSTCRPHWTSSRPCCPKYYEDYQSEALIDDLKKQALKEMIPPSPTLKVKDIMMFRNMPEDSLNAAQVKTIIMERIAGDVQDQVIRMDVDQIETRGWAAAQPLPPQEADWANILGYGRQ